MEERANGKKKNKTIIANIYWALNSARYLLNALHELKPQLYDKDTSYFIDKDYYADKSDLSQM